MCITSGVYCIKGEGKEGIHLLVDSEQGYVGQREQAELDRTHPRGPRELRG